MTGTSMDAIDAVVLRIPASGQAQLVQAVSLAYPASLHQEMLALNSPGHDELGRAAQASAELARLYAQAVAQLLANSALQAADIAAIGVHGQTVRHRPDLGYTVQLNAPALLAELTGIDVIADFRSRDIAAGGQGAPLVPAFHASQFADTQTRVVLNLGGIANITLLNSDGRILGFDTGPANMLLDAWIRQSRGDTYDNDGKWAASGQYSKFLLDTLLADPWFNLPPPKSTGRDDFNLAWLQARLEQATGSPSGNMPAADIQATLSQLTAFSVAQAIRRHAPDAQEVLACGGGTQNHTLMADLRQALPCPLRLTDDYGLPSQWVEATAFAWLAWCHDQHRPAGLPDVTGARHPTVLGCKYPA